jgi:hypothetical protein
MLGLETPIDAQSKISVLTFLVILAADNTPSLLVYIYFLWEVFLESGILSPLDDSVTVMVTCQIFHQEILYHVYPKFQTFHPTFCL